MKRLLLLLFFPLAVFGQPGNAGSSISGFFANRPVCSRTVGDSNAHSLDVYRNTDDRNVHKCPGGAWWTVGGRTTGPTISSNPPVFDQEMNHAGSNIYIDIRAYGAYATFSSTTCTTANGSPLVRLGAASNFKNDEYATCNNAGPAATVSTPSAPTVTPSAHAGGMTVVSDRGGATSYAYEVAAEDKNNGRSAASAAGSTFTGAASLGQTTIYNFSECTRSAQTVTCTTTTTHSFVVGQLVYVVNMNDTSFNGTWIAISPTRGTTVTWLSGWDTRNGASASTAAATPGNVYGWKLNRVSYTTVTNAFRYHIYGPNCPTVCGWMGQSVLPFWDDYGPTMMANQTRPAYIPATAPSVGANQHFTFKINAGGGTTTLAADSNAGVTGSSTIISDVGPSIVAAAVAAKSVAATTSCVVIPNAYVAGSNNWQINSYTDVSASSACIKINGTNLQANNTLAGAYKIWGEGSGIGIPNFGTENLSQIYGNGFPLIFNAAPGQPSIRDLNINTNVSNGGLGVYLVTPTNMTWKDVFLTSGGGSSSDCTGIPVLINNTATGFTLNFKGLGGITGTCPNGSPVPAFVDMSTPGGAGSGVTISDGWFLNRMSFNNDLSGACGSGFFVNMQNIAMQNATEPALQISGTCSSGLGGNLNVSLGEADFATPLIGIYTHNGTRWQGTISGNPGVPNGGGNAVVGAPVAGMSLTYEPPNAVGANTQMTNTATGSFLYDGSYGGPSETIQNQDFALGKGFPLFTTTGKPAAATCTTITGGPPFPAAGIYNFRYLAYFQNGGSSLPSPESNSCTVDGSTQQITVTIPSAVSGAVSYQIFLGGGAGNFAKMNNTCSVNPQFVGTLSGTFTGGPCGGISLPTLPGGGPAGIINGNMWAQDFILGATPAPTGTVNATQFYMDSTALWPSFKPNGNRAYVVPGITGPVISGHNLCADGTSGAYVDCLTTQTIASGTARLGTSAIAAKSCAKVVTTSATGVVTADAISYSFDATPSGAYTTGLFVQSYVTPGKVNFLVCNPTTESLTPPGANLNWRVTR